jgi:pimeloyl-ACP methyl ester carboxylesterase
VSTEQIEIPVGSDVFEARAAGPADGPLVVLLHGFPQSSYEWMSQLEALAGAGFRAVAPDQRGYSPGARPTGVEHYAVGHLVNDVMAIADELGGHRFHLVGHDWGAIVAWHTAAAHAGRLRSLTIVSVPHPSAWARSFLDPGSDQRVRSSYIAGFKTPGGGDAFLANGGEGLRQAFAASGLAGHDVEEHVRVLTDPGAMDAALNWYRAHDFTDMALDEIGVPTLFVWSTEDPAIAREGAELTGEYVKAPYRFEVLEGAPHWIPEANAQELSSLLLQHLAANS